MIQTPVPPIPPEPPIAQAPPFPIADGPPEAVLIATVIIIGIIAAGVILLPLIKALARRLEGGTAAPALAADVEHLRNRVADLEQIHNRMAELEERVDFSERLLTQSKDPLLARAGTRDAEPKVDGR